MSRAHTISLIRHLTALGDVKPKRRPGRWPPTRHPEAIGLAYRGTIVRQVCTPARDYMVAIFPEIFRLLTEQRHHEGKTDHLDARTPRGGAIGTGRAAQLGKESAAKDTRKAKATAREVDKELAQASAQGKRAAALIDHAAAAFADAFRPDALFSIVSKFGQATDAFSRQQLDQQLRSAIGVPFSAIEKPHRDKLSDWSAANVDLIKTLPDRYFDDIRLRVEDAFTSGMHPRTLADNLADAYDISENDAERIARDQTLTLAADLNQERMTSLGVERYYWRDAGDGRVRDNHEELARRSDAGETFAFDDPPMGGGTSEDEEGNPGSGICCRCFSEPVLDDLING